MPSTSAPDPKKAKVHFENQDREEQQSEPSASSSSMPTTQRGERRSLERDEMSGPPNTARRIQREKRSAETDVDELKESTAEDATVGVEDDVMITIPASAEPSQNLADATDPLPSSAA